MRKVSMTARDELVNALARRYAVAGRAEKTRILDEFVAIAGFHRKHAMRLLRCDAAARRSEGKAAYSEGKLPPVLRESCHLF